ncbi:hypothetical protein, partial [Gluconacetobacter sacchari]|uniref:hypothetical protein n=1 Tax=Gluconacetobacter sacchari TaxID=92759 RepID=UPI0022315703
MGVEIRAGIDLLRGGSDNRRTPWFFIKSEGSVFSVRRNEEPGNLTREGASGSEIGESSCWKS